MSVGLMAFGTVLNVMGSLQAGRAAKSQQQAIARQQEEEAEMLKLQAVQQHNDRLDQLELYRSQVNAMAAVNRRSYADRSVRALVKAAEGKSREQLERQSLQALYGVGARKYAASQARYAGKMAVQASYIQAAGSLATGMYRMSEVTPRTGLLGRLFGG